MGRRAFIAAGAALMMTLGLGSQTSAQTAPVVVELFTSQGCNSCPPADEILGRLADREDVIALSLHVDYWDYLGWRDIFASPAHTQRQRDYARSMGERMVYTPQIVVNGREGMVGSRGVEVETAIDRHLRAPVDVLVSLKLDGEQFVVEMTPVGTERARGKVMMVWYRRAEQVDIRAGENTGRRITYHNVVHGWSDLGSWRGDARAITAPKPMDADGVAVLVQDVRGPILGAGGYRF